MSAGDMHVLVGRRLSHKQPLHQIFKDPSLCTNSCTCSAPFEIFCVEKTYKGMLGRGVAPGCGGEGKFGRAEHMGAMLGTVWDDVRGLEMLFLGRDGSRCELHYDRRGTKISFRGRISGARVGLGLVERMCN